VALGIALSPAVVKASGAGDKPAANEAVTSKPNSNAAPATSSDAPAKPSETLESELQELRDLIESQSRQIQAQSEQLKEQQQQMQALEVRLKTSDPAATVALAAPAPASAAIMANSSSVPAMAAIAPNAAAGGKAQGGTGAPPTDEPQSLKFKGITLTPGGYFAAETVWRNRAIGSDINSSFNAVPLPGNEQSHISEFQASGRQSRIAMAASGRLKSATIGGYYEMDFLSAGTTSNNNQSNSYTLRQRQFWAQAKLDSGLTFTGGQMWSLVTETKAGTDNRSEATTQTIDAQYNVGFSWARQYGFRVQKNFSNKFWLAAAIEEGQTNNPTVHGAVNPNYLIGSFGVTGGLYNPLANYAFNAAPDFIVKAAFQPKLGHFEVFGLLTTPRDRVYPCAFVTATTTCSGKLGPSALGAFNDTRNGGGIGANARIHATKHVDFGVHFLGGDGIGRYGSVGLPNLTLRGDGTIAPIRNYQSLGTIEIFTNKLDVYMYLGDEYESRTAYGTTSATAVGYGSRFFSNAGCWTETIPGTAQASPSNPIGAGGTNGFVPGSLGSCTNDTKHEMEGTVGFWYRFYRGSHGTLQMGLQESYFLRYDWNGVGTTSGVGTSGAPHGTDNMVFTSFRYVLP
jgi:hypothetical protein